jgi:hypothetical protein
MRVNNVTELLVLLDAMIECKAPMTFEISRDIMCFIFEERQKKDNEVKKWMHNCNELMVKLNENK